MRLSPEFLPLFCFPLSVNLINGSVQAVVEGQEACASLQDAIAVVEFLAAFGEQCQIAPLSLHDLHSAAAWPLDSPALVQLYTALLRCILQDQVSTMPDGIQSSGSRSTEKKVGILSLSMSTRFVAAWPLDSPALVQLYTAIALHPAGPAPCQTYMRNPAEQGKSIEI